jgi:hypothetical protein
MYDPITRALETAKIVCRGPVDLSREGRMHYAVHYRNSRFIFRRIPTFARSMPYFLSLK